MSSSIYTRSGDKGSTSLVDGTRVSKVALRVQSYGTIDEANSWIGTARAFATDPLLTKCLTFVQNRFYNCSSNIATPPDSDFAPPQISADDITWLERAIDVFERTSGPINNFIVPGGSQSAALLHVARTVCRRAERLLVELADSEPVDSQVRAFVNRSSDFLFAAARYANAVSGDGDVFWQRDLSAPDLS